MLHNYQHLPALSGVGYPPNQSVQSMCTLLSSVVILWPENVGNTALKLKMCKNALAVFLMFNVG